MWILDVPCRSKECDDELEDFFLAREVQASWTISIKTVGLGQSVSGAVQFNEPNEEEVEFDNIFDEIFR